MAQRQDYLRNLIFSYSPFLVHIGITLLVTPFAVHRLGEFEYGVLVLFNTLLGYLALGNVGTPQTVIRRLIRYDGEGAREKARGLVSTLFAGYTVVILLGGAAVWVVLDQDLLGVAGRIVRDSAGLALLQRASLLLFLVFAFDLWRLLFDSLIVAKNKIHLSKLLLAGLILTRGVGLYLVLAGRGSLYEVLLVYAGLAVISCFFFAVVALREQRINLNPRSCRLEYVKDILPDSFWYFLGAISVVLIFQSDNLVISAFVGVSAITSYALMFRYVDIVGRLLTNIVAILFPQAAMMIENREFGQLSRLHDRLTLLLIPTALLCFGLLYLIGQPLFGLWMGSLDLFNRQLFLVFLLTSSLMLISAPATNFIEAAGWHRFSTKLSLLQGLLNLGLSILLVGHYGIVGVAWATLIALLVTNFPGNIFYFCRRIREAAHGD